MAWLLALFVFLVITGPIWFPDLIKSMKKRNDYKHTLITIDSWGISTWNYKRNWQAYVVYLSASGKLHSLPILDFVKLQMPENEMPKWWILKLGFDPKGYHHTDDNLYLIHEGHLDKHNWCIPTWSTIREYDNQLEIEILDRNSKTARIAVDSKEGRDSLLHKLLVTVQENLDIHDVWWKKFQEEGAKILLETKSSMGKSSNLEDLRRALELGTPCNYEIGKSALARF